MLGENRTCLSSISPFLEVNYYELLGSNLTSSMILSYIDRGGNAFIFLGKNNSDDIVDVVEACGFAVDDVKYYCQCYYYYPYEHDAGREHCH